LAFEQALGLRLPDEVREFLLSCDAIVAMNVWNGYWIGGTANLTRSVLREDFPSEFLLCGRSIHLAPIATDGGGNAFLVDMDDGGVFYWEHEEGSVSRVVDSFTAFLERVAEDWKHASMNDKDWRYLV
jgi:SMI1 / KNR4 family (SUKH-1)